MAWVIIFSNLTIKFGVWITKLPIILSNEKCYSLQLHLTRLCHNGNTFRTRSYLSTKFFEHFHLLIYSKRNINPQYLMSILQLLEQLNIAEKCILGHLLRFLVLSIEIFAQFCIVN